MSATASAADGSITIDWNDAGGAVKDYRVVWALRSGEYKSWRDSGPGNDYPTTSELTLTGLTAGEYKFKIRARYDGHSGPWSAEQYVTLASPPATDPPATDPPATDPPATDPPESTNANDVDVNLEATVIGGENTSTPSTLELTLSCAAQPATQPGVVALELIATPEPAERMDPSAWTWHNYSATPEGAWGHAIVSSLVHNGRKYVINAYAAEGKNTGWVEIPAALYTASVASESYVSEATERLHLPNCSANPVIYGSFEDVPTTHDGTAFTLRYEFDPLPSGLSFTTIRDSLLTVSNGTITAVKRTTQGSNADWTITITPSSSSRAVTVSANLTTSVCSASGAICDADGNKFALTDPAVVIRQPAPTISISSPTVTEPTMDGSAGLKALNMTFRVTLGSALDHPVWLLYRTVEVTTPEAGRATSGSDYTRVRTGAGRANIIAGSTIYDINIVVWGDVDGAEPDETVVLEIYGVEVEATRADDLRMHWSVPLTANGTIINTPVPAIPVADEETETETETTTETVDDAFVTTTDGTVPLNVTLRCTPDPINTDSSPLFLEAITTHNAVGHLNMAAWTWTNVTYSWTTFSHFFGSLVSTPGGTYYAYGQLHSTGITPAAEGGWIEVPAGVIESGDHAGVFNTASNRLYVPECTTGPPPSIVTGTYSNMPDSQDGSAFTFRYTLDPAPASLTSSTVRDSLFSVANGSVTAAAQVTAGDTSAWDVTVTPTDRNTAVRITGLLTEDCTAANAVCDADGNRLRASGTPRHGAAAEQRVRGAAPTITITGDTVVENAWLGFMWFTITIDRALDHTIWFRYEPTSGGTATAGEDYYEFSRPKSVRFTPGTTSRRVWMESMYDEITEGPETVELSIIEVNQDPDIHADKYLYWELPVSGFGTINDAP